MMKKEKEQSIKEIGVWNVTCWIFAGLAGLLSIFSCVVTIQAGQIFVGLLFLIPGIFAFVPKYIVTLKGADYDISEMLLFSYK